VAAEQLKPKETIPMQINIDGRSIVRVLAVGAATVGVGAATFFGGQSTRMDNTAVASVKHEAVDKAVKEVETAHAAELATFRREAKQDRRDAVRQARRETRSNDRHRAEKLADQARNQGYATGNSVGYSSGNAVGKEEGKQQGKEEGKEEGIEEASDELTCSDDSDADLPACDFGHEDDYEYDE